MTSTIITHQLQETSHVILVNPWLIFYNYWLKLGHQFIYSTYSTCVYVYWCILTQEICWFRSLHVLFPLPCYYMLHQNGPISTTIGLVFMIYCMMNLTWHWLIANRSYSLIGPKYRGQKWIRKQNVPEGGFWSKCIDESTVYNHNVKHLDVIFHWKKKILMLLVYVD